MELDVVPIMNAIVDRLNELVAVGDGKLRHAAPVRRQSDVRGSITRMPGAAVMFGGVSMGDDEITLGLDPMIPDSRWSWLVFVASHDFHEFKGRSGVLETIRDVNTQLTRGFEPIPGCPLILAGVELWEYDDSEKGIAAYALEYQHQAEIDG